MAYLEDRFLHTSTPISFTTNSSVDFSVTDDAAPAAGDRFRIVFRQLLIVPVTFTKISAIRTSENKISIAWGVDNEINIENFEVQRSNDAHTFTKINSTSASVTNGGRYAYIYLDENLIAGDNFYRIRLVGQDQAFQYSAVVKVAALKQRSFISIYPDPVVDKKLSVAFTSQPEGTYKIELSNFGGQVMLSNKLNVNSSNIVKTIPLATSIAAGTYQLCIIPENGSKRVEQIVIQ